MEIAILYRTVRMKKPVAQMPRVIMASRPVGQYSVMRSRGLGIKPAEINPRPLSM